MTIQYALLGLLSWRPFSGYDLKKIIANSDMFYWSGNNNQIYRALVELHEAGLVSPHVELQESLPAKKVYTITAQGQAELRQWVMSAPTPPELHNTFVVQLAWADRLTASELNDLLARYEDEVNQQLLMRQEKARRRTATPGRSGREAYLWRKISENLIAACQTELEWVRQVRKELRESEGNDELPSGHAA